MRWASARGVWPTSPGQTATYTTTPADTRYVSIKNSCVTGNASKIKLDPRVQVVIHMDGWGPPWMKKDSYQAYVYAEPVQFTGFKLFYKNDTKKGHPLMKPADILALFPKPLYIQYQ